MSYQGTWYFPALVHYHPSDLNLENRFAHRRLQKFKFFKVRLGLLALGEMGPF